MICTVTIGKREIQPGCQIVEQCVAVVALIQEVTELSENRIAKPSET